MGMAAITIRDATDRDIVAIGRLHAASWQATYRGLMSDAALDSQTPEWRVAHWRAWWEANDGRRLLLVADDGGAVAGFVAGWPDPEGTPGTVHVDALHADPGRHGQGIGRRLLARLAARAMAHGYTRLYLAMLAGNPAAGFYERLGGRIEGPFAGTFVGAEISEVRYWWDDIATLAALDVSPD